MEATKVKAKKGTAKRAGIALAQSKRPRGIPAPLPEGNPIYEPWYKAMDFRERPELYEIGRGEQGVLIAEPYKSEIGAHWRFKNPEIAKASSEKITQMFDAYLAAGDFPGADMARKYLQMGWTRARRYANHASGVKRDEDGGILPQAADALSSDKAQSAAIFKKAFDAARANPEYQRQLKAWREMKAQRALKPRAGP